MAESLEVLAEVLRVLLGQLDDDRSFLLLIPHRLSVESVDRGKLVHDLTLAVAVDFEVVLSGNLDGVANDRGDLVDGDVGIGEHARRAATKIVNAAGLDPGLPEEIVPGASTAGGGRALVWLVEDLDGERIPAVIKEEAIVGLAPGDARLQPSYKHRRQGVQMTFAPFRNLRADLKFSSLWIEIPHFDKGNRSSSATGQRQKKENVKEPGHFGPGIDNELCNFLRSEGIPFANRSDLDRVQIAKTIIAEQFLPASPVKHVGVELHVVADGPRTEARAAAASACLQPLPILFELHHLQ